MNDKQTNQTKPSEQEAGYENAWNCIQANIFARGLNEARFRIRQELPRHEAVRPMTDYRIGVIHACQH